MCSRIGEQFGIISGRSCLSARNLARQKKTPSDDRPGTPAPHENVKICYEVSFSHQLSPKPTGQAATAISHATTVNGRVDYGVGIITPGRKYRRFHSLMIAVEAKLKPKPKIILTLLSLSSLFIWRASVKLGRHVDVPIARFTALIGWL